MRGRGLSIQQKLPLLIGGLLLGVMAIYTWASYRAVKDAALDAGRQRLVSLTDQLAKLYEQSARDLAKATRTLAADSSVRATVMTGGAIGKDRAMDMLARSGPRPENTLRTELLDANRNPLLSLPAGGPGAPERHEELDAELKKASVGPDYAAVGPLRLLNDSLVVPAVAAVLDGTRPIGYLVRWRKVATSKQGRDQLSNLLGANAGLYLGNDRGDVWTDLVGVVPKPPVDARGGSAALREYTRPGAGPVLAISRPVPGTPWVALVEFSRGAVMASADNYLRRAAVAGLVVLLAGGLLAWMLSRSITRPLGQLTQAATSLAAGNFSHTVDTGRADELGQLSTAFNTMVGRVAEAQHGLEEKVRDRTVQLEERNEELEAFAHSISHDLRAPLRAMHGFSKALLEDCAPQMDATAKDYAQRIAGGAERMDALIQDLLAYSRMSRAEIELTDVDLADVTADALSQLDAQLNASHGKVEVTRPLAHVVGHRLTLVQVVANLLGNGLKFVANGRSPEIQLRAEQSQGTTRLWVEDNGIGIAPSHHERVFGIFERLHQSEDYPGTGIGLAIVRKGVERMGGRVGVESAPGKGSRFWIELRSAETMA